MLKILIAEDEWIERESMRKLLLKKMPEMTIVGEAKNGREAVDMTRKLQPDIILMDIKMPGMTGIEAVKMIKATNQKVKIAMVTAYDSFDYAKEAMHYGIKDYILKPSQPQEIIEALNRMKADILREREQFELAVQSTLLAKNNLLNNILANTSSKELSAMQEALFPEMVSACFYVVMTDNGFDEEMTNQLKTMLPYEHLTSHEDGYLVIYLVSNDFLDNTVILSLAKKIHHAFGDSYYIGTARAITRMKDAYDLFRQAYAASYKLKYKGQRLYGFMPTDITKASEKIKQVYTLLELNKVDEAALLFEEYNDFKQSELREELYIYIKNKLSDEKVTGLATTFSSLKSNKDWKQFFHLCAIEFQKIYKSNQSIAQIKQFIAENYQKSITLEEMAEIVRLSPNYFSNLFKQQTGKTLTEYITDVRMSQAKEFILENKYNLKEISYLVGYNEPNYFSRVFKKYYQQSPKQFQKEIFK